ncbi:UDP-glucose 4-epimerase [Dictyobacter alpinus]|uniref:UDP-glucose 4-epimerase n=1 Tax=Dictyobacter alpinus TaxID=2014873 RepID=A0A402B999_9CHLR|nr:NAD-dependent epimerase/dehydratase family protein [Dictyobacter alpinus]GCE27938.1 UDP-glucose 4-epimerase [Dictyobacter alpinus]
MKIAITGGAGFVGSHLTKAYQDAGHDVIVLDSLVAGSAETIDPRARFYHVDIRDGKLRQILQAERPDIVSHHATQQHEMGTGAHTLTDADVHVRGLINVLDSCVSASVKHFVFASGGNNLYGRVTAEQLPLPEETCLQPRSAQDISKLAGEWYTRYYTQQYGLKHTILRYADIYGETNANPLHHPLSYFMHMLNEQKRPIIRGSGNEVRDHIFIDDVIRANMQLLKKLVHAENRTFHISTGQGHSLNQLYHMLAIMQASKHEPIYLSSSQLETPAIILDNTRALHALGWQPCTPLSEGIRQSVQRLLPEQHPATLREYRAPQIVIAAEATLSRA